MWWFREWFCFFQIKVNLFSAIDCKSSVKSKIWNLELRKTHPEVDFSDTGWNQCESKNASINKTGPLKQNVNCRK